MAWRVEKNINAQHFYKRHGFKRVGQHVFQVGDDLQIDWLLLKNCKQKNGEENFSSPFLFAFSY